jgi:branched-subunit amino acid transport protein AzlD
MQGKVNLNAKFLNLIEFIPISAFGIIVRLTSENGVNWKLAFIIGGCFAVISKALFLVKRFPLDRLLLGTDVFLVFGGLGYLFNIQLILNVYLFLFHATFFASLLIIGVLTTFLTERGFIGVKHHQRNRVITFSLYLFGAGVVAFLVSFAFRGDYMLAGVLPFTGILAINWILAKRLHNNTSNISHSS